jgi:hypothetical protein
MTSDGVAKIADFCDLSRGLCQPFFTVIQVIEEGIETLMLGTGSFDRNPF